MRHVLASAQRAGARTNLISGPLLQLPLYQPENIERGDGARFLVAGWPTPLGAAINSAESVFDDEGICLVPRVGQILEFMAEEVMSFARPAGVRR